MWMSSPWAKLTAGRQAQSINAEHPHPKGLQIQNSLDIVWSKRAPPQKKNKERRSSSIHVQAFSSISIKFDVQEGGLKRAWLFQMKTFSPWNWLLLKLAGCSVALLNWEQFRGLKWAGGDVKIMPVSDLGCSPCQVSASLTFLLN